MPDWSYRTIFRPLLFRLPERSANRLALTVIGALGRLPGGHKVIDWLGHMKADPRLERNWLGVALSSPVGLGPLVDPHVLATAGLARFGVGYIEIGPVTENTVPFGDLRRAENADDVIAPGARPNPGIDRTVAALNNGSHGDLPIFVHLDGAARGLERLLPFAAAFIVDLGGARDPGDAVRTVRASGKPLILHVNADADIESALRTLDLADGIAIDGVRDGPEECRFGGTSRDAVRIMVERIRQARPMAPILAGGGVHEPADALALLDAGADLVRIDTGLIFGGPGLPKRCNEAILARLPETPAPVKRPSEQSWFWAVLMGAAMLGGGLLALIIAATRVVLPYDETFCGMTREQLSQINSRLLAFMSHDRVSLAGTMVAVGVSYIFLGAFGIRRGRHWAWVTVLISALAGFASFFLFLGFGYFDPFHAFVTASLFPLLLQVWSGYVGPPAPICPDLHEDRAWKRSLWAQLIFVVHGAAVLGAGLIISGIGATTVFVTEDLEFMGTTAELLRQANPQLVPLIAHDRASFGGMLISSGVILLLSSLWGWRRAEGWLWWMYLLGFAPAYAAAIGVHLAVGYTDFHHLLPATSGAIALTLGLVLGHPYLCWPRGSLSNSARMPAADAPS